MVFPIDLVMNERMGETRSAWKKAVIKLNLPRVLSNPLIVTMDGDVPLIVLVGELDNKGVVLVIVAYFKSGAVIKNGGQK